LSDAQQRRVVAAMQAIEAALGPAGSKTPLFVLRPHRAGDMGHVIARHAVLYAEEYGWDSPLFEAMIAEIAAHFLKTFDSARERCWIAEMDGEPVGSVFVVNGGEDIAKLRLLLVEPQARGYGLGRRLVEECIGFARAAGYRRMTLWTHTVLTGARHIYKRTGFRLVEQFPHNRFGHDLMGETWELAL
jgi:GNAT superfamily N-acetyltransferase